MPYTADTAMKESADLIAPYIDRMDAYLVGMTGGVVNAVADHAADHTGAANTHVAMQAAMDAAAGGVLVIPPGSYRIGTTVKPPSNIVIYAYGAKFLCYDTDLGNSDGDGQPVVQFEATVNQKVYGLEIDGRQASWAHTEYKHGFGGNGTDGVTLVDCYAHDCKGDGFYAGSNNPGVVFNKNWVKINCRGIGNYRGGFGITDMDHLAAFGCAFNANTGTSPMFGLDVEPDQDDAIIHDLHFYGCDFSGNGVGAPLEGSGIYITLRAAPTAIQEGIYIHGGRAFNNSLSGISFWHSRKVVVSDLLISGNAYNAVEFKRGAADVTLRDCDIIAHATDNRHAILVGNSGQGAFNIVNTRIIGGRLVTLGLGDCVHVTDATSPVIGLTLDGVALVSGRRGIHTRSTVSYLKLLNISTFTEVTASTFAHDVTTQQIADVKGMADTAGVVTYTPAAAGTVTPAANRRVHLVTMPAGNITLGAPTLPATGAELEITIIQPSPGSRLVTWNAAYKFAGATAPTLTTTANRRDVFRFRHNGTNWQEIGRALNIG